MENWLIYKHTNLINGKSYIGLTKQEPERRWQNGYGYSQTQPYFYNAIQKYGWDNFEHEILEENLETFEQAAKRETYWIAFYHTWVNDPACMGYNLSSGGEGNPGHTVSEETKLKLSKANSGKKHSETTKQKLSSKMSGEGNPFFGKCHTLESRKKISNSRLGKKLSSETKLKISESNKGRPVTPETKLKLSQALKGKNTGPNLKLRGQAKSVESIQKANETKKLRKVGLKPVLCVETGKVFASMGEAAQFANTSQSNLSNCLAGRTKTAGKYHWRFIEE